MPAKNNRKQSFAGLGHDIIKPTEAPGPRATFERAPTHVNFLLDDDLVEGFMLNLAWMGPGAKRKDVMNTAMRFWLANDPEAKHRANTPFPGLDPNNPA